MPLALSTRLLLKYSFALIQTIPFHNPYKGQKFISLWNALFVSAKDLKKPGRQSKIVID